MSHTIAIARSTKKSIALSSAIVTLACLAYSNGAQAYTPESISPDVSAQVCKNTTKEEIQSLFTRWNKSLSTLDPAKVTANYTDDAVLLPTVSNTPRTDHAQIQDYFVHFLQKKPSGVINQSHVKIGCNKAYDVGVYTFTLHDGKKTTQVKARYSYVYQYQNGQWLISHHHSSVMPEAIAVPEQAQHGEHVNPKH
jgi:uncharacterized protein (TIGR02246 family)